MSFIRPILSLIFIASIAGASESDAVITSIQEIQDSLAEARGKDTYGENHNQKDAFLQVYGTKSLSIRILPSKFDEINKPLILDISTNSSLLGSGTETDSNNGNVTSFWKFTRTRLNYPYIDTLRVTKSSKGSLISVEISTEGTFDVPVRITTESLNGVLSYEKQFLTKTSKITFKH